MNKILKVLALGAMALSTTACSDFLEVNPRTQVSETEFYKTEDDMMKGLYAVMNEMQTRMPEVWSYSSLLGDESETGGGIGEGSYKTKWDTFTYDATSCFGAWGYGRVQPQCRLCQFHFCRSALLPCHFLLPSVYGV